MFGNGAATAIELEAERRREILGGTGDGAWSMATAVDPRFDARRGERARLALAGMRESTVELVRALLGWTALRA